MCSYITETARVAGAAKGPSGWFEVTQANVYFDHPYFASSEHTLNIDFVNAKAGPAARVAVELTAESARQLVAQIEAALATAGQLGLA